MRATHVPLCHIVFTLYSCHTFLFFFLPQNWFSICVYVCVCGVRETYKKEKKIALIYYNKWTPFVRFAHTQSFHRTFIMTLTLTLWSIDSFNLFFITFNHSFIYWFSFIILVVLYVFIIHVRYIVRRIYDALYITMSKWKNINEYIKIIIIE